MRILHLAFARARQVVALGAISLLATAVVAPSAHASAGVHAASVRPAPAGMVHSDSGGFAVAAGLHGTSVDQPSASATGPDDITSLGGDLFVTYQNGVGPDGSPSPTGATSSTIVQFHRDGLIVHTWTVTGKCDGLSADVANNRIIGTINEDAHSSLLTITPSTGTVTHYAYNPSTLTWGGGTDAVRVVGSSIYISASAPTEPNSGVPALISVTLDPSTSHANWTSVLATNEPATNAATGTTAALNLTDADSNNVVPSASPAFPGQFVLDSQGDNQLVFTAGLGTSTHTNTVVAMPTQVDDVEWATAATGTLYVVDSGRNRIDSITGTFKPGTAFVAVPGDSTVPGMVGTVDLTGTNPSNITVGNITPVAIGFKSPKGLLFVPGPPDAGPLGYRAVARDGGVFTYGDAPFEGSAGNIKLNRPVVAGATTSDRTGYWLAGSDGGVFTFNAPFKGSLGSTPLNSPIVAIQPTPDDGGYWLAAGDGGVFTFGDAAFYGSLGGQPLTAPIVGMAATPDGGGYWLVGADGAVYRFGDAETLGGLLGQVINQPIVGITPTPDGAGYWLTAADGGVFNFGDAAYFGSTGNIKLNQPIVGISATADGGGYWLIAADGGVFNFGDAAFFGSAGDIHLNQPVVAMTS